MDIVEKHTKEAESVGLTYIGKSKTGNPNYREYSCKEGHIIDLQVQHVRRNTWTCRFCYEEQLKKEAECVGYELLGSSDLGPEFRKYKKDCGCIEDLRIASVRHTKNKTNSNIVTCRACIRANLEKCAKETDITLLEDIDTYNIRIKFNKCGHFKDAKKSQVVRKNLVCRVCQFERFAKEAKDNGLILKRYSANRKYIYTLPCGCEKEMEPCDAREGSWSCAEHFPTHYNKPCDLYLNFGFMENFQFIKVGIANNIFDRINSYGADGVNWANMGCVGFDTKLEAVKYEKEFHRKFKHYKIPNNVMKKIMQSGFTECYEMEAYWDFRDYFNELSRQFGHSVRFRNKENR